MHAIIEVSTFKHGVFSQIVRLSTQKYKLVPSL